MENTVKSENQPLVSVGIPTYNRPEGLKRTLECITGQTYKNLEIIISDNCSTDPKVEAVVKQLQKQDNRIQYFKQIKNFGLGNNFKFVLEKATGEYFMWAADDDEWDYQFVEVCIENIGNACSIMTGFVTVNRVRNSTIVNKRPHLSINNTIYKNIVEFLTFMASSLYYGLHKRESIIEILNEKTFDFFDCYFVLKQIVNKSFITLPNLLLYRAGIDSYEHIKKPIIKKTKKLFSYLPFLKRSSYLIVRSKKLKLIEKIKVLIILLNKASNLFVDHERGFRPFQVNLMLLVCIFFRLLFKIYKILKIKKFR